MDEWIADGVENFGIASRTANILFRTTVGSLTRKRVARFLRAHRVNRRPANQILRSRRMQAIDEFGEDVEGPCSALTPLNLYVYAAGRTMVNGSRMEDHGHADTRRSRARLSHSIGIDWSFGAPPGADRKRLV